MSGWQPPPSFAAEDDGSSPKIDDTDSKQQPPKSPTQPPKSPMRTSNRAALPGSSSSSPKRTPKKKSSPSTSPMPSPGGGSIRKSKKKERTSASWAPAFVVGNDEETEPSNEKKDGVDAGSSRSSIISDDVSIERTSLLSRQAAGLAAESLTELPLVDEEEDVKGKESDSITPGVTPTDRPSIPTRNMSKPALKSPTQPAHSVLKSPTKTARFSASTTKKKGGGGGVNWNQEIFVAGDGSEPPEPNASSTASNTPKPPPRRGFGSLKRHVSRKDTFILDQEILDTRLEWTQQLVSESFKPYKKMICDMDDDLPDIDDILFDEDDYFDEDHEMKLVRDEMLEDPKITERETAAFFEGYKLFQTKANSLQAQLDAVKSMQKTQGHTSRVLSSRQLQLQSTMSMTSDRLLSIRNRAMKAREQSMPALVQDRASSMMPLETKTTILEDAAPPVAPPVWRGNVKIGNLQKPTPPKPEEKAPVKPSAPISPAPIDDEPSPQAAKDDAADESDAGKPQDASTTETANNKDDKADESPKTGNKKDKDGEDKKEKDAQPKRGLMMSGSRRALSIKRIKDNISDEGETDIHKLLEELEEAEKRQKNLEKQMAQAGVVVAEDIPYDVAKAKVASIAKRMGEIGGSDSPEYFELEKDMEKYTAALMITDEYQEEQEELERKWERSIEEGNQEAIKKVRRHMPVEVRNMSETALATNPTPNGKRLPKDIAKKFKRTNVLQLLRIDPSEIVPMHPSTLENMRVTGMTLTERRAMYNHLKSVGPRWKAMQSDKMTERKWTWYSMMKSNFKENVDSWQRHVDEYGPPGNHPYATRKNPDAGCPLLGKQCPLKADLAIDYSGDFGYPEGPEYFQTQTKKNDSDNADVEKQRALEAAREQKSLERSGALKKHYKGKILQVSLASGSCENMDECMDKIEAAQEKSIRRRLESKVEEPDINTQKKEVASILDSLNFLKLSILQFAERSGMQLTGKRDSNADEPDIRSMIELALCEEVIDLGLSYFTFVEERLGELGSKDGRMLITQLRELMDELHDRTLQSMSKLDEERPPRSRTVKEAAEVTAEIQKEIDAKQEEEKNKAEAAAGAQRAAVELARPPNPMMGGGGRGDLMGAIAGRGRGGGGQGDLMSAIAGRGGRGGGDAGRGDLMSALAGRGRGGRGGAAGGRGNLMSAIAGRGRGGRGGADAGGRGDLMSAIAGRGRGGRGGADAGGRGDLMSAIAGRGKSGGGSGAGGGGRGDLMSAIAGRGKTGGSGGGGRGDLMSAIAAKGRSGADAEEPDSTPTATAAGTSRRRADGADAGGGDKASSSTAGTSKRQGGAPDAGRSSGRGPGRGGRGRGSLAAALKAKK